MSHNSKHVLIVLTEDKKRENETFFPIFKYISYFVLFCQIERNTSSPSTRKVHKRKKMREKKKKQ